MMKVVNGQGIMPVTNARVLPSWVMCVMVAVQRAPEQEGTDKRDQRTACNLELGRATAIGEGPADDSKSSEDQDQGEPDMGQREDRAIGDAFPQLRWLPEMVGHQHSLAVSWHQRMDRAKQHSGSHGGEDRSEVAASDFAKALRHCLIEPVLDSNDNFQATSSLMVELSPKLWRELR